ncbi:hypothetical protein [Flavobacterium sp. CS20]|uniref:hypothetical protein n=1 Tax=Flavobacterium sp. CS20 TaxID=2775246 RepID=UPI001B3A46CB|nr:hypothetical protein [Flavobacterium sp. CS20]QTY25884.1 hypothetical protein IGB25_07545 [Flavobacterium sp. CS20]
MKKILVLILVLFCFKTFSQTPEKKYQYIIVPVQYGFLDEVNEYQLNVLTRLRLKEVGFEVYMNEGEEKPQKIKLNRCLALNANVKEDKGIFTTTLIFELKDCFGKLVYQSEGTSRLKPFKEAYQQALNRALEKFQVDSSLFLKTSNEKQVSNISEINSDNKETKEKIPFEERANAYQLYGQTYWSLQKDDNYTIFTDKGKTIFANLEYAGQGSYSFDSADIDGLAFFDANGNLIVEYLAKEEDTVQKLEFKKQ